MRKPIKTDFGNEIIFAQEDWFTGSFLNFSEGKTTKQKRAKSDMVFYVDDGIAGFTINGSQYEFGYGKTVFIKKGTLYNIYSITPTRIVKISKEVLKNKDFAGGKDFSKKK